MSESDNGKIIQKLSKLENEKIIFCSIEEAYKKCSQIINNIIILYPPCTLFYIIYIIGI